MEQVVLANCMHFCHQEASLFIMVTQQEKAFFVLQFAKLGLVTSVLTMKSPCQAI
jgi:hypothetical protein